jgi:hypothetical protein
MIVVSSLNFPFNTLFTKWIVKEIPKQSSDKLLALNLIDTINSKAHCDCIKIFSREKKFSKADNNSIGKCQENKKLIFDKFNNQESEKIIL